MQLLCVSESHILSVLRFDTPWLPIEKCFKPVILKMWPPDQQVGTHSKCKIFSPIPDLLLNRKLWEWGPKVWV